MTQQLELFARPAPEPVSVEVLQRRVDTLRQEERDLLHTEAGKRVDWNVRMARYEARSFADSPTAARLNAIWEAVTEAETRLLEMGAAG